MQVTNNYQNYSNPNFTAFNFSSPAKFIVKSVLKEKDPEYINKCIKIINSQKESPVNIDVFSHHNYWESHSLDKLRAEINGESFMSKRRADVLGFLETLSKEADKRFGRTLANNNIKPEEAVSDLMSTLDRIM